MNYQPPAGPHDVHAMTRENVDNTRMPTATTRELESLALPYQGNRVKNFAQRSQHCLQAVRCSAPLPPLFSYLLPSRCSPLRTYSAKGEKKKALVKKCVRARL